MWFASDGNRPSLEEERSGSLHPTRREAEDQRPLDSNPRPHRKKGVSIKTGQMPLLLEEAAWSPRELTGVLCLYFLHLKASFAAHFTSKWGKKDK